MRGTDHHNSMRIASIIRRVSYAAIALSAAWFVPGIAAARTDERVDESAVHLASVFARRAQDMLNVPTPTPSSLELATLLLHEACELDPDDEELARLLLTVARVIEDEPLRAAQVKIVSALDPADDWLQLEKLLDALRRFQNVDDLRSAYARILSPENIERLNPAIASRVALDYALLLQREGDDDAFADWIATAASLDQTNKAAAGAAAGYYNIRVNDPIGQCELFINLLMADPTDLEAQATLARHLLTHGGYRGAARMYAMTAATHEAYGQLPSEDLILDRALAAWGAGDRDAALAVIRDRIRMANRQAQAEAMRDNPALSPLEREAVRAPLSFTIASIQAALLDRIAARLARSIETDLADSGRLSDYERELAEAWLAAHRGESEQEVRQHIGLAEAIKPVDPRMRSLVDAWARLGAGDAGEAERLLASVVAADRDQWLARGGRVVQLARALVTRGLALEDLGRVVADVLVNPDASPAMRLEVALARAWMTAMLGRDAGAIERALSDAQSIGDVHPDAVRRFEAFALLRRGDAQGALDALVPLAVNDVSARAGVALCRHALKDHAGAIAEFRAAWMAEPSTLLGVWCRDWLDELAGASDGSRGEPPSALGARLDELIAGVPPTVDRVPTDPNRVLSVRLEPVKREVKAYEPVLMRLSIVNNAPFPLGISPRGPLQPHVIIEPTVTIAMHPRVGSTEPLVIDIGRRLRLLPRERLDVVFDLRRQRLFDALDATVLNGGNIELRATVNYRLSQNFAVLPSSLGSDALSGTIRVNGIPLNEASLEDLIGDVTEPDSWADVKSMALLAHALTSVVSGRDARIDSLAAEGARVLAEAFVKLPPEAQAWVLTAIPTEGDPTEALRQHARATDQRLVQIAFLFDQVSDPADPVFAAMQRGDDARVKRLGELAAIVRDEQRRFQGVSAPPGIPVPTNPNPPNSR